MKCSTLQIYLVRDTAYKMPNFWKQTEKSHPPPEYFVYFIMISLVFETSSLSKGQHPSPLEVPYPLPLLGKQLRTGKFK